MELRVQCHVLSVVLEEVEHDLVDAGPIEERLIDQPRVRRDARGVVHAVEVLGLRGAEPEAGPERVALLLFDPSAQYALRGAQWRA